MIRLEFTSGDAAYPAADGPKVIAHVCNDMGYWGAGFVLTLSGRWPHVATRFTEWFEGRQGFGLGEVDLVRAEPDIWVANMVAQHGVQRRNSGGVKPIRYDALAECLDKVAAHAAELGASVHMPRIGCGLAGGRWRAVAPIVKQTLCAQGIRVVVYDLPSVRIVARADGGCEVGA